MLIILLAYWIEKYLILFFVLSHTHPVSIALVIALVSSEERCIATFPIKTNLLRGEQVLVSVTPIKGRNYVHNVKNRCKIICNPWYTFASHRIDSAFGARHDQARVQSVALSVFVHLSSLVHMCTQTLDLQGAHSDSGFNANSIVFNGLGDRC